VLRRYEEIESIPANVLVVAYDEVSLLGAKMLQDLALPFPLGIDTARTVYAEWGMGRTNLLGAMLSPSLNWRYLRLLLKGERFLGLAPDMFQLGGDFVVDPLGTISFAYRMRNNGDRADVARLVHELRQASGNVQHDAQPA